MSFVKARMRSAEAPAIETSSSNKCAANGCPLRGTITPSGGRYVCAYHHSAQPEQWPRVTEAMREHKNIIMGLDEVIGMGDIDWAMGKWEMLSRFFSNDPELQPTTAERNHRRWYEYRLHNWLMYLAGVTSKRPVPREALGPSTRRGNIGQFLSV